MKSGGNPPLCCLCSLTRPCCLFLPRLCCFPKPEDECDACSSLSACFCCGTDSGEISCLSCHLQPPSAPPENTPADPLKLAAEHLHPSSVRALFNCVCVCVFSGRGRCVPAIGSSALTACRYTAPTTATPLPCWLSVDRKPCSRSSMMSPLWVRRGSQAVRVTKPAPSPWLLVIVSGRCLFSLRHGG